MQYYSTMEVCKLLKLSRPTVYKLFAEHNVKVMRVGNTYRISEAEVKRMAKALTVDFYDQLLLSRTDFDAS